MGHMKKKGYYPISVVSNIVGIHQQTIRMYEREGLISPIRSSGNTRMFSDEDVEAIELIIFYTGKLGVNLSGVEIILKMQRKIDRLQKKINEMFKSSQKEFYDEKKKLIVESKKINKEMEKIKERIKARKK
jgi:MerR family transcriptional regulator, heat shock protein HspR